MEDLTNIDPSGVNEISKQQKKQTRSQSSQEITAAQSLEPDKKYQKQSESQCVHGTTSCPSFSQYRVPSPYMHGPRMGSFNPHGRPMMPCQYMDLQRPPYYPGRMPVPYYYHPMMYYPEMKHGLHGMREYEKGSDVPEESMEEESSSCNTESTGDQQNNDQINSQRVDLTTNNTNQDWKDYSQMPFQKRPENDRPSSEKNFQMTDNAEPVQDFPYSFPYLRNIQKQNHYYSFINQNRLPGQFNMMPSHRGLPVPGKGCGRPDSCNFFGSKNAQTNPYQQKDQNRQANPTEQFSCMQDYSKTATSEHLVSGYPEYQNAERNISHEGNNANIEIHQEGSHRMRSASVCMADHEVSEILPNSIPVYPKNDIEIPTQKVEPPQSMTVSPPGNFADAVCMYIDHLIAENQNLVQITDSDIDPNFPICFEEEVYYQSVMSYGVDFPTPKFRHWLQQFNVDVEIASPGEENSTTLSNEVQSTVSNNILQENHLQSSNIFHQPDGKNDNSMCFDTSNNTTLNATLLDIGPHNGDGYVYHGIPDTQQKGPQDDMVSSQIYQQQVQSDILAKDNIHHQSIDNSHITHFDENGNLASHSEDSFRPSLNGAFQPYKSNMLPHVSELMHHDLHTDTDNISLQHVLHIANGFD